jgi:pimeloyl-ACP methyl ester carboxylesterase
LIWGGQKLHSVSIVRNDVNADKPLLLWISGGPVAPFFYNADSHTSLLNLDKDFIPVYWDKNGIGKSSYFTGPKVSSDAMVGGTIKIAEFLKQTFPGKDIYLVGESFGTIITLKAALQRPELFKAVINIGQVVDVERGEELGYEFAISESEKRGDKLGVNILRFSRKYFRNVFGYALKEPFLRKYGGYTYNVEAGVEEAKRNLSNFFFNGSMSPYETARSVLTHVPTLLTLAKELKPLNISKDHDFRKNLKTPNKT